MTLPHLKIVFGFYYKPLGASHPKARWHLPEQPCPGGIKGLEKLPSLLAHRLQLPVWASQSRPGPKPDSPARNMMAQSSGRKRWERGPHLPWQGWGREGGMEPYPVKTSNILLKCCDLVSLFFVCYPLQCKLYCGTYWLCSSLPDPSLANCIYRMNEDNREGRN